MCIITFLEIVIFFYALTQAVVTSKTGTVNNVIQVKRTDFEVFDALRIDSQDSADVSGTETCSFVTQKL